MLVAVARSDAFFDKDRGDERDAPVDGPARHRICPSQPGKQLGETPSTEIGSNPNRTAIEDNPANQLRIFRGDYAALALLTAAIKHQPGFLLESGVGPVVNATRLGHHDLTMLILTGDPIRVFRLKIGILRVEHIHQAEPIAAAGLLFVDIDQFREIVAKAQANALVARGLVALEHEPREELHRTVLECQRIREPEIVLGDDVRINQTHRDFLANGFILTQCAP